MQVLHSLPKFKNPDMLVGTETGDDAGVYRLRPDLAIVNTVDFFTPIVDDPYVFGQISAANSLSDVYAMGGEPKTCMNIVCFPKGKMDIEILGEILKGGADKVMESGAVVIGGHSIIDEEIKFGMAVTGVIHPDKIFRNVGVQEGDVLILTKPLGTGIITTALKKGKASEESVNEAVKSMTTLNAAASLVARKHPVHACSDVTGFGILGHALGMASGSGVTLVIESAKLPLLRRAPRLAEKGYITGGCKRNQEYLNDKMVIDKSIREGLIQVALDPQTSGGLLLAVAKRHAAKLVDDLHAGGVPHATEVGYATSLQKSWVRLV
ncbi:MAG: selenide, water dikinase SelD [Deltaproteobacteria bacterium]|nr:MAG: selenide, water dikinase SelD [Deltaproteobacteria bacterium]